jgi:hypothetical protein
MSYFYLKQNVSETGFCLHLQAKHTQLGLIYRASPDLWRGMVGGGRERDIFFLMATLIHERVGCAVQRTPMNVNNLCYTLRKCTSGFQCHTKE